MNKIEVKKNLKEEFKKKVVDKPLHAHIYNPDGTIHTTLHIPAELDGIVWFAPTRPSLRKAVAQ